MNDGMIEKLVRRLINMSFFFKIVKLIAIHCMNALHCILATRSIVTMLSSIRDTSKQEISYSKKLPNTLINAFGKAQSFHSARLESVTGARVKIEDERILIGML